MREPKPESKRVREQVRARPRKQDTQETRCCETPRGCEQWSITGGELDKRRGNNRARAQERGRKKEREREREK